MLPPGNDPKTNFHLAELERLIAEARRDVMDRWDAITGIERQTLTSSPNIIIQPQPPAEHWLTPARAKAITVLVTAIATGVLGALQASGAFSSASKNHDHRIEEQRRERWRAYREQHPTPRPQDTGGAPNEQTPSP
jgi:hypothetical protein